MQLPRRSPAKKRWMVIILVALLLLVVTCWLVIFGRHVSAPSKVAIEHKKEHRDSSNTSSTSPPVSPHTTFLVTANSTTDPASLWVIVNKPHPLKPINYTPPDLTSVGGVQISNRAATSLQQLISDAKKDGLTFIVQSGYRSYSYQVNLYNSYVAKDTQAVADTYSARPGHSEHQTGLAADLGGTSQPGCNLEQCFADTPEGKWLATNAGRYGFIIRYQAGNQAVTGYTAEPWHIRYIGSDLVNEMKRRNTTTLEEFFAVTGGARYATQ